MKAPGGRQSAPPTNHTIVQKYDFLRAFGRHALIFKRRGEEWRERSRGKGVFRRLSAKSGLLLAESPLLSRESPPLLRRRRARQRKKDFSRGRFGITAVECLYLRSKSFRLCSNFYAICFSALCRRSLERRCFARGRRGCRCSLVGVAGICCTVRSFDLVARQSVARDQRRRTDGGSL